MSGAKPWAETVGDSCRALVVDDDERFRAFVGAGLTDSGIRCDLANGGAEALAILDDPARGPFDIVLLDIMMPEATGWEVLAAIRERAGVPVIFVSARESVEERVRGLRLGADDYIVKPFAFAELLARMDAVMRRRRHLPALRSSDLHLELIQRLVTFRGAPIDLSPKEFDLLRVLVEAKDRIVSRRELLREVWQVHDDPGTNVVEVHVGRLRRKLEIARAPWVRTVRGKGYTLSSTAE